MSDIQLYSECLCNDTIVPNNFIDQYMPDANGEFVKVYLYLLRCLHSGNAGCTVSAIADRVNHTENDVVRALNYWEKQGLLALMRDTDSNIRQIRFLSPDREGKTAAAGSRIAAEAAGSGIAAGTAAGPGIVSGAAGPSPSAKASAREEFAAEPAASPAFTAETAVTPMSAVRSATATVFAAEAAIATASAVQPSVATVSAAGAAAPMFAAEAAMVSASQPAVTPASAAGTAAGSAFTAGQTPEPVPAALSPAQTPAPAGKKTGASRRKDYTLDEIDQFRKNPDISELFFVVETYMKHPLTQNDTNTLLYWHEELHFSTELIVYLLEYCISKGHSSMRYLDKVALGWHEKGITTVVQAKEDAAIHSQAYYGVMKALGITGRNLIESETSYIKKWTKEFGFDLPLIQEACSRTIAATHQPSFEYTDSILTSWHKNQVHTRADVEKLDSARSQTRRTPARTAEAPVKKNAFTNFNQRSYDYDKLEELLLTTSLQ